MLSIDLAQLAHDSLLGQRRPEDGMLHPSGDIIGPLRHTMLRMAGAPYTPEGFASLTRLNTGTMWHDWLGQKMEDRGLPVMREVSATSGLPAGWAGTADFLVWDVKHNAFVLVDLKTTKGKGMQYIAREGAKPEHVAQTSAYWHAFVNMGYPMLDRISVLYLPLEEDYDAEEPVEPIEAEVIPQDFETLWRTMEVRKGQVDEYLDSCDTMNVSPSAATTDFWLTDKLAEPMPRGQKLFKNKDIYNVTLVPHWSAMFCPYDDALCACGGVEGETKTTKIGHWISNGFQWDYVPREGYEDIEPVVSPPRKVSV